MKDTIEKRLCYDVVEKRGKKIRWVEVGNTVDNYVELYN
jgi:hypothetical protein